MDANKARSRRDRNAHIALTRLPLAPLALPSTSPSMASNVDAAFVEDIDVDQDLRARNQPSQSQPKAPVFMPMSDNERDEAEDAPLLSPTAQDYGSASGGGSRRSSELEWAGEADFKGLPWWNRPSVRPAHCCIFMRELWSDMNRYFGSYRPFSSSP
jgi:hypothetical protein